MTYYLFIQDNRLNGAGECPQITEGVINFEVNEELYNDYCSEPQKYIYLNNEIVINPDYQKELEQKERERLDNLSLTAADVERAIYKAKGMDFEDILELVKDNPEIDFKALKIELKANNFYRGNPYVCQMGEILGFSEKQLDEFFETNDYTKLTTPKEEDTSETVLESTENALSGITENTEDIPLRE